MSRFEVWSFVKKYRFNSIFLKNLLIITLVIVIPFSTLSTFFYINTKHVLSDEIDLKNKDEIRRMRDITDNILKEMDILTAVFLNHDDARAILMLDRHKTDLSEYRINIMNEMNMFKIIYPFIRSIYIYSEQNQYILTHCTGSSIQDFVDSEWLEYYENSKDSSIVVFARTYNGITPNTITVMRPFDMGDGKKYGAVMINLDVDMLKKNIGDSQISQLFLTDSDGNIIYSTNHSYINTNISGFDRMSQTMLIGGDKYKFFSEPSVKYDFDYTLTVPREYYEHVNKDILFFILAMIIFTVLICLSIAFFITRRTFRPLKTIINHIDNYDENISQNYSELNELTYIVRSIVDLNANSDRMTKELEQSCKMLNDMQLLALQSQINPHFLYNTLEALKWMIIRLENTDNSASQTLTKLSRLLKYSLDMDNYLVDIATEIEYAKQYVEILKLRYNNKFDIRWEIDDTILKYRIIKLSIQPLIENAVYHGLKPKREFGTVVVRGSLTENGVCIQVSDDGVGISEEGMNEILTVLNNEDIYSDKAKAIGLRNVNRRIKITYGDSYGLKLESSPGKGTTVYMIFDRL